MKLHEYQAKMIFKKYGIPVPRGFVIKKGEALKSLPFSQAILKAQVLVGGRAKAGGIISVDEESFEGGLQKIFSRKIRGEPVEKILVEEKIKIKRELYAALTIDKEKAKPLLILSTAGGVDIELVPKDKIIKAHVPITSRPDFGTYVSKLRLNDEITKRLTKIFDSLWRIFIDYDAELVEINPLAVIAEGVCALDAVMLIDDNALFRHPDIEKLKVQEGLKGEAERFGLRYIPLEGDIGIISNGAGLTMAAVDAVRDSGGIPGCFLDLGGGASRDQVKKALEIVYKTGIKKILINVFGGITSCTEVAEGVVSAFNKTNKDMVLVVRLIGRESQNAKNILQKAGILVEEDFDVAIKKVISP